MTQRSFRRMAPMLILAALLLSAGCSDDDLTTVAFGSPCLEFTAAAEPTPGTVTFQNSDDSSCDVAEVVVVADGVSDVAGASFVVNYDPLVVQFGGSSFSNSFLTSDGVPIIVNAQESSLGRLEVGISRVNETIGVSPTTGDDVLIRLFFVRVTNGGGDTIELEDAVLLAPGTPPTTIPGVIFSGGDFTVTG